MKIISKFKDFYDYKVAKYGMDELLVYDRRKTMPVISELPFPKKLGQCNALVGFELYIGNKMIFVFKSKDRVYTQFDMIFPENKNTRGFKFSDGSVFDFCYNPRYGKEWYSFRYINEKRYQDICRDESFKKKFRLKGHYSMFPEGITNEPILIYAKYPDDENYQRELVLVNPILNVLGIYLDPDLVWQTIAQFLSDLKSEKEISPEVPNDAKIINKGFDIKTSFRPKMKNSKK